MNGYIMIAGVIALATVLGHFTVGSKQFLMPMLRASFDPIPQKVMHIEIVSVDILCLDSSFRFSGRNLIIR